MRKYCFIVFLFAVNSVFSQQVEYDSIVPLEPYNFVLGTNGIAGKYQFTNESKLIEIAKHIRGMGSNILKISLGKKSPKSYRLSVNHVETTLELFQAVPDYKEVFDMDFKYIFAWVHTLTDVKWKQRINKHEEKQLYNEMFEFATYLLKEYNNSGKTFMIGNWEGDWLLHKGFNRNMTPSKDHINNMLKWFQIRQKAIDDAKRKTKHTNVCLYHYIEVNLVKKGMLGKACITKDILPKVDVDFVSYSSYELIKNKTYEEKKIALEQAFNFIEKQLKPKKNLPFSRRVYLGEYGYHANIRKPQSFQKQFDETKEIMKISLELNIPFALHWQMYNNEYQKNGISKEMSLIDEQGKKRPLYYLHQNFYKKMNSYLKSFKKENNVYPSSEEFRKKALEVLEVL
ncbi:hypothetical protein P8625_12975 [Tenacibaculum tangerinum]|uniref:Cellulase n=1 Tax=Tenacibaculum tangerinum TaxID=3038772 RepID=A0ABY8L0I9_9FLAO|nr:hypothetical protein [Tenacibaculum tangerinum]WGH74978.1 hypothetical protein P8625_12975 [Tenacibaculum tangerinum]